MTYDTWKTTEPLDTEECVCCGASQKLFLVRKNIMGRWAEWPMCAGCASEEDAVERYERYR